VKLLQTLKKHAQVTWKVASELRAVHSEYNIKAPHEIGAAIVARSGLRHATPDSSSTEMVRGSASCFAFLRACIIGARHDSQKIYRGDVA
jgi:hypothetical protein